MPPAPPPDEAALAAAARQLLAQPRRWPVLRALALPAPAAREAAPWTTYWHARLAPGLAAAERRALLAAAWDGFELDGQGDGSLLALAALIETYYVDEGPLQPMDPWVERLERRLPAGGEGWPSPELEAEVMACGRAILLRDQRHPLLARWAARAGTLLRELPAAALRVRLATFVLQHHLWHGEFGASTLVVDALPGIDPAGVDAAEALAWYQGVATHARFTADFERGRAAIDAALALLDAPGCAGHAYAVHAHGAALALAAGDSALAKRHIDGMRPVLEAQSQADQTHYWHYSAGWHLLQGDTEAAAALALEALDNSLAIGGGYRTAVHRMSLGQILLARRDAEGARAQLDAALAIADDIGATLLVFSLGLLRAQALLDGGRADEADAALAAALALGARHGYRTSAAWWQPQALARLLAHALGRDIEPAYAAAWARRAGLIGPAPRLEAWPWALKLRAFGELRVWRDDRALDGGRAAQRPLDLLRALLAEPAGGLPVSHALDWLWPEADPGDARKAFDVALLRLRRLCGDDTLLLLDGGRLRLDPARCWSDVAALADLLAELDRLDAREARPADLAAEWARLVRGRFLDGDEAPWVQAARERWRQRIAAGAERLAALLETHDPAAARAVLQRAFDVDPGSEPLVRRLVRAHLHAGDRREAERTLQLAGALRQLAGESPLAPETRALVHDRGP